MSAPRSRAGVLAAAGGLGLFFPVAWVLAHLPATGRTTSPPS